MNGARQTGAAWGRFADWVMGIYAWIVAFAFGAAVIDSIYSRSLADSTSVAAVSRAFNEASDFQALPLAVAVLTGIAALIMAADKPLVRYLMIASLGLTLAPLAIAMLLGDLVADAGGGAALRLALSGGASLLALAAAVLFLGRARSSAPGVTPS